MLIGRVRQHLVDHHLQPQRMRAVDQAAEVAQRAEHRIDRGVVGDVVAEVLHRALEERRQPHRVDAEPGHVLEARSDAGQIADAVGVAVGKAARIDLVDDAAAPPVAVRALHRPL
jgi:hypothetical protein